jgi:hypothetical protein
MCRALILVDNPAWAAFPAANVVDDIATSAKGDAPNHLRSARAIWWSGTKEVVRENHKPINRDQAHRK